MSLVVELLSTNVGRPSALGVWQGKPIVSGIRKAPVTASQVEVGATNIVGDEQADLSVHGGIDRAIYAYTANHWEWWRDEAKFDAVPASFGENLTLRGAAENEIRIGDKFLWGPALLEVSVPRAPCFKFALLTGRQDMGTRMTVSGRTGWYFRVLQGGTAPAQGAIVRVETDEAAPLVIEAFTALYHPRVRPEIVDKVLASNALPRGWRAAILERRRKAPGDSTGN